MNDKYLNYISLRQITKYCPRTLFQGKCPRTLFQGKVSADTFFMEECPWTLPLNVSAETVSGFLDGA